MRERAPEEEVAQAHRQFEQGLFEEHLEEASFLYEQRRTMLQDGNFEWLDVRSQEERLERHLSTLVDLGARASDFCMEQQQDPGGLYVTVCLLCRHGKLDALGELVDHTDPEDDESFEAALDGLKHELPQHWQKSLPKIIDPESERFVDAASVVFGYGRWPLDGLPQLRQREITPSLAWAIGRSGSSAWLGLLQTAIETGDESLKKEAAISLLRHGQRDHLPKLIENATDQTWPMLPLGLGGDLSVQRRLMQIAESKPNVDCLVALGVLGDCSAVELLLSLLAEEDLADAASLSLNLITGAELYEEVFIPEEIDEDSLLEEELEKLKRGEPLYPPGEEPGETIERLSHNPEQWKTWWKARRSRFRLGAGYRLGKPYSPASLVDTLELPRSPHIARKLAYEELVIRYRAEIPFETDMLVTAQLAALAKYRRWSHTHQRSFKVGRWH